MAIVVRTQRFKDNNKATAHLGPGTYVGQDKSRNRIKESVIPFNVNIDRKLIREEQDMNDKNVFEHIEDQTKCNVFSDFRRTDAIFTSKSDRFEKERNKVPGPGAYKQIKTHENVYNYVKWKCLKEQKEYRNFTKENREKLIEELKRVSVSNLDESSNQNLNLTENETFFNKSNKEDGQNTTTDSAKY